MNCQEVSLFMSAYQDRELGIRDTVEFEQHLQSCPACLAQYEKECQLHQRIKAKANYFQAPSYLASQISSSLPELKIDTARSFRWPGWLGLSAGAITLAAVACTFVLYISMPSAEDQLAEEVIANHVRSLMADHLSDVASSDQHTVKPWFNGKIDYAPQVIDLATEGFPLVGGRLDYLKSRPVAALVYRHRLHSINVFVFPEQLGDQATKSMTEQGYHLVHWRREAMNYWVISDLSAKELKDFVDQLQTHLNPKSFSP